MPQQDNPYDFITEPSKPKLGSPLAKLNIGGSSVKKRIFIVSGGAVFLIILLIIFSSILSNSSKNSDVILADVVEQQSELNSISVQASTTATTQVAKNLAATLQLSMISDQARFLNTIKKEGVSLSSSQITKQNPTITSQLTTANQDGTFDSVYVQIVQNQLNIYASDLQQAYSASHSATRSQLLSTFIKEVQLLQSSANLASQNLS